MSRRGKALPRLFYTAKEIAESLGLDAKTVVKAIQADQIPSMRFAGQRTWLVPAQWLHDAHQAVMSVRAQDEPRSDAGVAPGPPAVAVNETLERGDR